MSLKDIAYTFEHGKLTVKNFTYNVLIEEGYVKKHLRYFAPTDKLLDKVFVPLVLVLNEYQRRWFSVTNNFYGIEAVEQLDGNEQLFKFMVKSGMFKIEADKRYRKSERFEEMLTEGETTFKLKEGG